jgi:glycerol-3-phosphate acyltransferase PlsY
MFDFLQLSIWGVLFAVIVGYLFGSTPSGVVFAWLFRGPDPRTVGSTHTGATNVLRNVNWVAGALTGLLDLTKGVIAVWLVMQIFPSPWVIPLTGVAAVVGHCWPVFTHFRGGMGVATAGGLALWQFPLLVLIVAAAYLGVNYFLKHQARTMMVVSAFLPLMLLPFRPAPEKMALASGIAVALVIRWASDFNRIYD